MQYSWFHCFFIFASICCIDHAFSLSSSFQASYTKHCSSLLPEYKTTTPTNRNSVPPLSTSYFTGGDTFLRTEPGQTYYYVRKNLRLRILPDCYKTNTSGVYRVDGFLALRFPYSSDNRSRNRGRGSVKFPMTGFWSEDSRKLCMLGSALWKGIDRDAVLKVKFEDEVPSMYTSVASGSFESTAAYANDSSYFDPIVIFSFPTVPNYNYTLVRKEAFPSDSDAQKDKSLSVGANEFCSVIGRKLRNLGLQYAAKCTGCSPVGLSPSFLSLASIECREGERKARFMAKFENYTGYGYGDFDAGSTLIGEVSWDDENKRLIGVACGISNPLHELENAVRDCTVRLSMRFPSVVNIRNDAKVVGQIWSSISVDDSGYFDKISFESNDRYGEIVLPELKYEYTEMDRVRKLCPSKKPTKKGNVYPDVDSQDMRFYMYIKNGKGKQLAWADARPSWVGNDQYQPSYMAVAVDSVDDESVPVSESENRNNTLMNMSYTIWINPTYHFMENSSNISSPSLNWSTSPYSEVQMTAEGLYDAQNGLLCMVGCRKLDQNSNYSKDCEVVMEIQFPPLKGRKGDGLIKGTIRSTRERNDPLHFDDLTLEAQDASYYVEEAKRSIWRMDLEITVVLVSNTLVCIFVGLQLFHVKRNPEVPSSISLVMLVILCVGYLIPLVVNFEAVFLENHHKKRLTLGSGGRLEANEVAVRVITMVALLLQLRLFQLVWAAKGSGNGEKKAGVVSLSLYILGGMLALLLKWIGNRSHSSIWGDLRSYAGLILDGFLVPQILLNIFRGSAEKALSHPFYIGTSAVRLVPHAYNQYRAHNYPKHDLNGTYYYANPAADFYSSAWDIMIPCGIVALAVIVFLQQRLGGRCILPRRFKALEMYVKVPTADNQ